MAKIVTHNFYVGEKRVMLSEWYEPMSKEMLEERALEAAEMGYGTPDTVVDSTGRMVKLAPKEGAEQ